MTSIHFALAMPHVRCNDSKVKGWFFQHRLEQLRVIRVTLLLWLWGIYTRCSWQCMFLSVGLVQCTVSPRAHGRPERLGNVIRRFHGPSQTVQIWQAGVSVLLQTFDSSVNQVLVICWDFWWVDELFMVALCNRADHIYFHAVICCCSSFFSSPNLSGRRLDVYHTSTHGVALVRI